MSFAEMQYYGNGRIIADTSTFSVGDKIRVRSMVDNTKIWDKTVATVGTPLVYDVPCKDYYKMCIVRLVSGVETEIGGYYKTLDFGQTLFIDVLDKDSLLGIKGIVNAHQENTLLSLGDEVTISVNAAPVTFQIAAINLYASHEVIFVAKDIYTTTTPYYDYTSTSSGLRPILQSFYANMTNNDKSALSKVVRKCRSGASGYPILTYEDFVWTVGMTEVGSNQVSGTEQSQFPLFATQANRIKKFNGTAAIWYSDDGYSTSNIYYIKADGSVTSNNWAGSSQGVVPCFAIRADA